MAIGVALRRGLHAVPAPLFRINLINTESAL